jgi:cell division GTPase FtsZ
MPTLAKAYGTMDNVNVEIPELPLEAEVSAVEEEVKDTSGGAVSYAFIGSGQGGCRIAEAFFGLGYKKTICVNTAKQDLDSLSVPEDQRVMLDAGEMGAGKDMRVGESAAEKGQQLVYDKMMKMFGKVDHVFVCVGAGGGSGGGSTLVLVEAAKKYMAYVGHDSPASRVGVIMTLPTNGECASPNVANNAQFLVEHLCWYAREKLISPLIFVDNDRIGKLYPNLTVKQFWPTVNQTVAGLFHIFNIIPTKATAYTTFDAADYGSLMRAGGCMIMGVTKVKDPTASTGVSSAIKDNFERTLLAEGFDLKTAKVAAAVVLGGKKIFESAGGLMKSIDAGFDTMAVLTGNAMMHRGVYEDDKDRLNVYTLVGGLDEPKKRVKDLGRFQAVKGDEKNQSKMPRPSFGSRLYDE